MMSYAAGTKLETRGLIQKYGVKLTNSVPFNPAYRYVQGPFRITTKPPLIQKPPLVKLVYQPKISQK